MRIGNLKKRAVLVFGDRALDIETASGGRFSSSTRGVLEHWDDFRAWAEGVDASAAQPFEATDLDAPVDEPRQVLAIGLNYKDHADEASLPYPDHLVVFTKFASSLGAPYTSVELPSDDVDYETELVIIVGTGGHKIAVEDAWDAVAGVAIGQDYSERTVQRRGPAAQFSLGKSYPNFGPYGPYIVTPDELKDPDALRISAVIEGPGFEEPFTLQDGNTSEMIFSISQSVSDLSQIVTLLPGDLIFTGTPAGVGLSRGILMRPGHVVTSTLEGVGSIRNEFF